MSVGMLILLLLTLEILFAGWLYKYKRDLLGSALIPFNMIVISVVLWSLTREMSNEVAGPASVPMLYIFLLICSSVMVLFQIFRGKADKDPGWGNLKMMLIVVVLMLLYIITMDFLGYFLSSLLFIAGMIYLLTYRNHIVIWSVALGWACFSYFVFYKLLFIQLPLGYLYETFWE